MSQSRQLAAIMFTDIVGYTALMDEDEQKAFELLKKNRLVQRPIIEKHDGRWLKEIGDGVLASFKTITDAVYAAQEIQKACESESDLKLRIGIHQGEVVFDGEDVFGSGVNIASRLEPLAPIGGILVSQSIHNNVRNIKDISTKFFGEEQLRGVKEPVKVYQVQGVNVHESVASAVDTSAEGSEHSVKSVNTNKRIIFGVAAIIIMVLGYIYYSSTYKSEVKNISKTEIDKSIAVLPFKSLSADPEKQYLADAVMDAILLHLSRIENLRVITRTSVERYRNSTLTIPEIAEELNVHHVLEGSFQKHGDMANLIVQLSNAQLNEDHLWANEYNRNWSDIFAVQSEVAQAIARELQAIITAEEKQRIEKAPTKDIAAYDFYIRADQERLNYINTGGSEHLKAAHQLYDAALNIDPDFLMAIVGKGEILSFEYKNDSALVYAERAISLDPKYNKGYGLKGECHMRLGNEDLAIEFLSKAISLPPKDDFWCWYHQALGQIYIKKNNVIKGLPHLEKSISGASLTFQVVYINQTALAYRTIGDYERAEKYLLKSLELNPDGCWTPTLLARTKLIQGKFQEAFQFTSSICQKIEGCREQCYRRLFQESLHLGEFEQAEQYYKQWQTNYSPNPSQYQVNNYLIGYVYHRLGKTQEAEKVFNEQIEKIKLVLSKGQKDGWGDLPNYLLYDLSSIYAFQGDNDEALRYLSEYAETGFTRGLHDFILIDPFFEGIRDEPKFKAIVKQAQDEKAALKAQVQEMIARGELEKL